MTKQRRYLIERKPIHEPLHEFNVIVRNRNLSMNFGPFVLYGNIESTCDIENHLPILNRGVRYIAQLLVLVT